MHLYARTCQHFYVSSIHSSNAHPPPCYWLYSWWQHPQLKCTHPILTVFLMAATYVYSIHSSNAHTPPCYCILDGSNHNWGWHTRIRNLPLLSLASPQLTPTPISQDTRTFLAASTAQTHSILTGRIHGNPPPPSPRHPYPIAYWRCHWLKPQLKPAAFFSASIHGKNLDTWIP